MDKVEKFSVEFADADPDQVSQFYRENLSPIIFQALPPSKVISNRHAQYRLGDLKLWSCQCSKGMSLSYKEVPDSDAHAFYLPEAGMMSFKTTDGVQEARPGHLQIANLGRFEEVIMMPRREHVALSLPDALLRKCLSELLDDVVTKELVFEDMVSLRHSTGRQIASLIRYTWQHFEDDEVGCSKRGIHHLSHAIAINILERLPHNFTQKMLGGKAEPMPGRLKRAIDFMHAHAGETLTVIDIAKAAGSSVRALQLSFQQFKGTTPLCFLTTIRMQGARDDLLSDRSQTVSQVAQKWGFFHVGRFSRQYHELYGELPSETLKRR